MAPPVRRVLRGNVTRVVHRRRGGVRLRKPPVPPRQQPPRQDKDTTLGGVPYLSQTRSDGPPTVALATWSALSPFHIIKNF